MIGYKLGTIIGILVAGLRINSVDVGSESDRDLIEEEKRQIFVGNLPDRMVLNHMQSIIRNDYLAIPEEDNEHLLTSLRTAWAKELSLDKDR